MIQSDLFYPPNPLEVTIFASLGHVFTHHPQTQRSVTAWIAWGVRWVTTPSNPKTPAVGSHHHLRELWEQPCSPMEKIDIICLTLIDWGRFFHGILLEFCMVYLQRYIWIMLVELHCKLGTVNMPCQPWIRHQCQLLDQIVMSIMFPLLYSPGFQEIRQGTEDYWWFGSPANLALYYKTLKIMG